MFGVIGGGMYTWLGDFGAAHILGLASFTLARNVSRSSDIAPVVSPKREDDSFPWAWWLVGLGLRGSVSLLSNLMSSGPSLMSFILCSHRDE